MSPWPLLALALTATAVAATVAAPSSAAMPSAAHVDTAVTVTPTRSPTVDATASGSHGEGVPLASFMRVQPSRAVVYKTIADKSLSYFVFSPPALSPSATAGASTTAPSPGTAAAYPALVFLHGGAWRGGDATVFFPHAAYFASRGYVAISIDYRLLVPELTGPGIADCFTDCKSALRHIRAHAAELQLDPARIAVVGDSAGGHLAAALGTVPGFDDPADDLTVSARPDALVPCNPIVDLTEGSWMRFVQRGDALGKNPAPAVMVPSLAQLQLARSLSPLFHVQPGQPPTLLMHGLDDPVVTPDQARQFASAYQAAGNTCELVLLPGTRHAFVLANYRAPEPEVVAVIRRIDAFLVGLGWQTGEPTLIASTPPAWTALKP